MLLILKKLVLSLFFALTFAIPISFFFQIPPVKIMGFWNYIKFFPKPVNNGAIFGSHMVYFYTSWLLWVLLAFIMLYRLYRKKKLK